MQKIKQLMTKVRKLRVKHCLKLNILMWTFYNREKKTKFCKNITLKNTNLEHNVYTELISNQSQQEIEMHSPETFDM